MVVCVCMCVGCQYRCRQTLRAAGADADVLQPHEHEHEHEHEHAAITHLVIVAPQRVNEAPAYMPHQEVVPRIGAFRAGDKLLPIRTPGNTLALVRVPPKVRYQLPRCYIKHSTCRIV